MTTGNLTEQDIKDLIVKFNLDESINDLKRYYLFHAHDMGNHQPVKKGDKTPPIFQEGKKSHGAFTIFREGVSGKYTDFLIDVI